jgi:HEPN domain-containing protein
MAKPLYEILLEIARLDHNASKVLASNGLIAQALFYCEQSFEKANKSVIVYYQMKRKGRNQNKAAKKIKEDFGHINRRAIAALIKILVTKEKEKHVSRGGSARDEFIKRAYKQLHDFSEDKPIQEDLIPFFNNAIKRKYRYYIQFSGKANYKSSDSNIKILRQQYSNPTSRYQMLAWILSFHLDGLDIYARYPMSELEFNNIKYLNLDENKQACNYLSEMISDFIEVVPLVWRKIDDL